MEESNFIAKSRTNVLAGVFERTLFTDTFFSSENVRNIQNLLKFLVSKNMNKVIDDQAEYEILTVMKYVYLTFAQHPAPFSSEMSVQEQDSLKIQYTEEIKRLNELVIRKILPKLMSQVNQHLTYVDNLNKPRFILENPSNSSSTGTRVNRSITQVLTGSRF